MGQRTTARLRLSHAGYCCDHDLDLAGGDVCDIARAPGEAHQILSSCTSWRTGLETHRCRGGGWERKQQAKRRDCKMVKWLGSDLQFLVWNRQTCIQRMGSRNYACRRRDSGRHADLMESEKRSSPHLN